MIVFTQNVARRIGACTVLAASAWAASPAWAQTVSIAATPDPAVAGSPVSLQVLVNGITDLYGFQFSLSFNPSVLQFTSGSEGSFLPAGGGTTFGIGGFDNTLGKVNFVFDTLNGSVPGVSGNGLLATLNFNAVAQGSSTLTFSDVVFLNSSLGDITVSAQNRVLNVVPEPASYALMALGVAGLLGLRRARGASASA
jgi:hypothetical protein